MNADRLIVYHGRNYLLLTEREAADLTARGSGARIVQVYGVNAWEVPRYQGPALPVELIEATHGLVLRQGAR